MSLLRGKVAGGKEGGDRPPAGLCAIVELLQHGEILLYASSTFFFLPHPLFFFFFSFVSSITFFLAVFAF